MKIAISTSLESVAAFECPLDEVSGALARFLSRFGEVAEGRTQGFDNVLAWLLPLASFSSRYVVARWTREWTLVMKNGPELAAGDEVNVLSRLAEARAVHAAWSEDTRLWSVLDAGQDIRSVFCNDEGDGWSWHMEGEPLAFEVPSLYERRRTRDRLLPSTVLRYLSALVGAESPPDWRRLMSQEVWCLERSLKDLKGDVDLYSADIDI